MKIKERKPTTVADRIAYLDIMKGLGILSVIAGHYWAPYITYYMIFSFHMPLFVLLSGYFMKNNMSRDKIIHLGRSYLIPYLITWFLNMLLLSLKDLAAGMDLLLVLKKDVLNYVASAFFALGSNSAAFRPEWIVKVGVIWFLMALFWGQLFLMVILKYLPRIWQQLLAIAVLWGMAAILTSFFCVPLGLTSGAAFVLYLFIGYRLKTGGGLELLNRNWIVLVSIVLWGGIVLMQYLMEYRFSIAQLHLRLFGLEIIAALAGCVIVLKVSRLFDGSRLGSILASIGRNTIWILCVHGIGIEVFTGVFTRLAKYLGGGIFGCVVMLIRLLLDVGIGFGARYAWETFRRHLGKSAGSTYRVKNRST